MSTTQHPPMHLATGAGQDLAIVLDAATGAGLSWQATTVPPGCRLTPGAHHSGGAGDGSATRQHFSFAAGTAGDYLLQFELRRSWEARAHAVQPVRVTVG